MSLGYVRPAEWSDIPILAGDLRPADIAEIKALSGNTPREAISRGLENGASYVACLPNDIPAAVFGVVPMSPEVGGVWMTATNQFKHLHRQFLRESREGVSELGRGYRVLTNITDARNHVHHRWIKWAGFSIIKRHEHLGVEQRPFLEFVRIME